MNKGQATIEFTLAFVVTILLIVLTANVFAWVNHCIVRRQVAYENSRTLAGSSGSNVGKSDFFTPPKLNVFKLGGR